MALPVPTQLGRYQVLEPIGQGAMGSVYKARDPAIDRIVALKTLGGVLLAFPEQQAEFLERFYREAQAAGRLSHPNIVPVYDLGFDEPTGTPFIIMEYVPGVSLATMLRENPLLPMDQALDIVEQIGSALEEAHHKGIVHRDIKPGNVFLDSRGRVKVGDFGIARIDDSELTQPGVGLGTPGYLAPEVLRGGRADVRTDVFALGVVSYQMLTGRKAFTGDTREAVGVQVLEREPEAPHTVRPEIPAGVSQAVMEALAKEPEARTPSVTAFLARIRAGRGSPTLTALAAPGAPALPVRGLGRRTVIAAGLLVGLTLLAGAGLLVSRFATAPAVPAKPTPVPVATAPRPRPTPPVRPAATPVPAATPRARPTPGDEGGDPNEGEDRKDDHKKGSGKGKGRGKAKKKGH